MRNAILPLACFSRVHIYVESFCSEARSSETETSAMRRTTHTQTSQHATAPQSPLLCLFHNLWARDTTSFTCAIVSRRSG